MRSSTRKVVAWLLAQGEKLEPNHYTSLRAMAVWTCTGKWMAATDGSLLCRPRIVVRPWSLEDISKTCWRQGRGLPGWL